MPRETRLRKISKTLQRLADERVVTLFFGGWGIPVFGDAGCEDNDDDNCDNCNSSDDDADKSSSRSSSSSIAPSRYIRCIESTNWPHVVDCLNLSLGSLSKYPGTCSENLTQAMRDAGFEPRACSLPLSGNTLSNTLSNTSSNTSSMAMQQQQQQQLQKPEPVQPLQQLPSHSVHMHCKPRRRNKKWLFTSGVWEFSTDAMRKRRARLAIQHVSRRAMKQGLPPLPQKCRHGATLTSVFRCVQCAIAKHGTWKL